MVKLQHELKGSLPETINGSPWYHYVDPAIDANQLEEVSNILNDEFTFLLNLFESDEAEQDSQLPAQIRGQEEEEQSMYTSTKLTQEGGVTCIETKTGPNSNCMTDNTSMYCEGERSESAQPLYA